jgi:Terpene synthase family 2, C-terminal metal binding
VTQQGPEQSGPDQVIRLPRFSLPFPSEIHPDTDSVIAHSCQWALATGLVPDESGAARLRKSGIMTAGPRLAPRASFDAACLICDWTVFLIVLDDEFDENELGTQPELSRTAIEDVTAAFAGKEHEAAGFPGMAGVSAAAADLGRRFEAQSPSPAWLARFRDHAEAHIWSKVSEAEHRATAGFLDVPSYIALRRVTSAAYTYADLAELAEQAAAPEQVRESRAWRQALDAAADVWLGIQDICSCAKEVTGGDNLNLAAVMARSAGSTLQQGIDDAYQWVCQRSADLAAQRAQLTAVPFPSSPVDAPGTAGTRYLDALERLLGGHLTWNSQDNPRYPQAVLLA